MTEWRTLTPADTSTADKIIAASYEAAQDMHIGGLTYPGTKTPEIIGISGVCVDMSDIATRMAHDLGIVASRERHERESHHITSFGPLDRPPSEEDLILCLTWGQFNRRRFTTRRTPYFGPRSGIEPYITDDRYAGAYGAGSVELRQTVHSRPRNQVYRHFWLKTSPSDLADLGYPIGEVPRSAFPGAMWLG